MASLEIVAVAKGSVNGITGACCQPSNNAWKRSLLFGQMDVEWGGCTDTRVEITGTRIRTGRITSPRMAMAITGTPTPP